eukprot:413559-Pleurochrysis_carterae.AAC.2
MPSLLLFAVACECVHWRELELRHERPTLVPHLRVACAKRHRLQHGKDACPVLAASALASICISQGQSKGSGKDQVKGAARTKLRERQRVAISRFSPHRRARV